MKISNAAIIGCTGLIGTNLYEQFKTKIKKIDLFNSKNILNIKKKKYDIVFCAALPATKWLANQFPVKDEINTKKLIRNLKRVNTRVFLLISTIDVYYNCPYGINRKKLEEFIKKNFKNYYILRLPGVFGRGLKKNIIFDLLNKNEINKICVNDKFQWYDLSFLYKDIKRILQKKKTRISELFSPPIENREIINLFRNVSIKKIRPNPISYCIKPRHGFYKNKKIILSRIRKFIKLNNA
jgi:nucleoside-diphosphate-sugar epimerase